MALKATAQITLSSVIDVKATYRYYLLQSSTLSKPAKPSTFPPTSTWGDVEPNYVDGSTSTLYFVDCTVFCDDTFNYSAVSVSSAYEAAKIAYNKALSAQNGVTALTNRVATAETAIESNKEQISLRATKTEVEKTYAQTASRGLQLVTNGNGMLGDNTNFSDLKFDGSVSNNSPGSFTNKDGYEGTYQHIMSDEFIPVDTNKRYTMSFDAKSKNGLAIMYSMLSCYDIDKNAINAQHHSFVPGTLTTLSQDLKAGDTVVHLTDVSTWQRVYPAYYVSFWNYTNNFGYTYPAETYTRNYARMPNTGYIPNEGVIDYANNTVTLSAPWAGTTVPAGTQVSQGMDGATYTYIAAVNAVIPKEWNRYEGSIRGVDYSGSSSKSQFPPAVAYCKVGFLWNYNSADDQIWVTNITVKDTTAENELSNRLTDAETQILQNAESITLRATKTEVTEAVENIEVGGRNLVPVDFIQPGFEVTTTREFEIKNAWAATFIDADELAEMLSPSTEYTIRYGVELIERTTVPTSYSIQAGFAIYGDGLWIDLCTYDFAVNAEIGASTTVQKTFTTPAELNGARLICYTRRWTTEGGSPYGFDAFKVTDFKIETGNKATDWTPAPEDVYSDIADAQSTADEAKNRVVTAESVIEQLADQLSMLVRNEQSGTLIRQDVNGLYYFDISGIEALEKSISDTTNDLSDLSGIVLDANGSIDVLKSTAVALQKRTEYVRSYTDENDQPCLELGEGDSEFKVRITNTEIGFVEGSDVPAKLNRKMLVIEKAMIKQELQFGDDQADDINGVWIWKRRANGNLGLLWKEVTN